MKLMFGGGELSGACGPAGPDGNPVGTVISFMGTSAPKDYLVCDGAEYGVSEYPELAAFFVEQFGAANHFGGDGVSTFAVPDMRNLFLRGYHGEAEEQLSGEIAEKQEATKIKDVFSGTTSSGEFVLGTTIQKGNLVDEMSGDFDTKEHLPNSAPFAIVGGAPAGGDYGNFITTRPVNMAVLFCVKAVESVPAENVYSTEETVIGRWMDGKPLYRIVKQLTLPDTSSDYYLCTYPHEWEIVHIGGIIRTKENGWRVPVNSMFNMISAYAEQDTLVCYGLPESYYGSHADVVIEYTKATD